MSFQLDFALRHKYRSLDTGITIDANMIHGERQFKTSAKIDTGAKSCVFQREIGEYLGIDIESGLSRRMATLTGSFMTFGHEVILQTLGLTLHSFVYFYEDREMERNILGRQGWLQLVRLGIIDHDEELYISHYNDQI
jgi:hypothetical protein